MLANSILILILHNQKITTANKVLWAVFTSKTDATSNYYSKQLLENAMIP